MATVGIRGCEIYLVVDDFATDVYVAGLSGNETVLVQHRLGLPAEPLPLPVPSVDGPPTEVEPSEQTPLHAVEVVIPGSTVSIRDSGAVFERDITVDDARSIIHATTPLPAVRPPDATGANAALGSASALSTGMVPKPIRLVELSTQLPDTTLRIKLDEIVNLPELIDPRTGTSGGGTDSDGNTIPDSTIEYPIVTTSHEPRESGIHWQWGVWKTVEEHLVDGVVKRIESEGFFQNRATLSATEVQTIANGRDMLRFQTPVDASGNAVGSAGAFLRYGDIARYVDGSCDLTLYIGGNAGEAPWHGNFSMNNANGDSLSFAAVGTIDSDSIMRGQSATYQLYLADNGIQLGGLSLSHDQISAVLVGSNPDTTTPANITGAIGTFSFAHGNDNITADGIFGTDLVDGAAN